MDDLTGLHVRGLTVRIGGKQLVDDVSFIAHPGKIKCVVGPNGAGKSTLIKALAGILPGSGSIYLDGKELVRAKPRERALAVGYVPQRTTATLPFTAVEVVAHGLYAEAGDAWTSPPGHRERALEILAALEMASFAGRIFNTLSGGEQQLVLLARALIGRPRLLLLDEPASALDIRHRLDLDTRLRKLANEGLTIVVVLHDLTQVLDLADAVVLLDRGKVAASGAAFEVLGSQACAEVFGVELVMEGGPSFRRVPVGPH